MRLTNDDREDWVNNDEGLYDWWQASGLSIRAFIRQNRELIDEAINNVVGGKQPAHYLKYGGRSGWPR
jgi:hypothetical protein